MDLRREPVIGSRPLRLKIVAVVFLSAQSAGERALLSRCPGPRAGETDGGSSLRGKPARNGLLSAEASSRLDAFELRRGRHPSRPSRRSRNLLSR